MQRYVNLEDGHMKFLIEALDGDATAVSAATLLPLSTTIDENLVREAIRFLRRSSLPIEPRAQWPTGGMPRYGLHGRIAPHQAQEGRALCTWGDAGWGDLVRRGKYQDGRFSDELVEAARKLVEEWKPLPEPAWVTCIPSLRHRELVPDFARRLADALQLPFKIVLSRTEDRPEQKTMKNSVQQARNVDGALAIDTSALPSGPALLVDDMVDSRWTFTVAAWLLHDRASCEVFPLALAITGH